jgi:hypothetical protein
VQCVSHRRLLTAFMRLVQLEKEQNMLCRSHTAMPSVSLLTLSSAISGMLSTCRNSAIPSIPTPDFTTFTKTLKTTSRNTQAEDTFLS